MLNLRSCFLMCSFGMAVLPQNAPAKPSAPGGGVVACSDGGGTVRLLWNPIATRIPAGGWRVQDAQGKVLDRLTLGDPAALAALPKAKAQQVLSIRKGLAEAKTANERNLVMFAAFVEAGQSPEMGRALGLATTIKGLAGSRQVFVVVGLDAAGNPEANRFTSAAVDPAQASPFPPPVPDLKALVQGRGVALSWSPAPSPAIPVMDYRVSRDGVPLMEAPFILGASWKPGNAQFQDREASLEAEHSYSVTAVDLFGRQGPATTVTVYLPDPVALEAPGAFKAEPASGRNLLTWDQPKSRYTTGFVIERAFLRSGPWEALVLRPLPASATRYEDEGVTPGTTSYYRIRSLNSRNQLGEPSLVVFAQGQAREKLAAPTGLAAQEGTSRIRLTWNAAPRPIAGFLVERRMGSEHGWARLNPTLLSGTRYDDYLGNTASGGFQYRVTAVDFDNSLRSSAPVSVVLEDRTPPPVPHLLQVSGLYGKVVLRFRPAPPVERTTGFLVLRSQSESKEEVVIGDPLPGNATEVADAWVQPGQIYRYRLLALAANGTRSEPSLQLEVQVGAPVLDAPPMPAAIYAAKPFARVTLTFPPPPDNVVYFLHRKTQGRKEWLQIQGPLDGAEARDVNPPQAGKVLYRLHARSSDGTQSRSGLGVEIVIP